MFKGLASGQSESQPAITMKPSKSNFESREPKYCGASIRFQDLPLLPMRPSGPTRSAGWQRPLSPPAATEKQRWPLGSVGLGQKAEVDLSVIWVWL